jgi:hypothetical protein
MWYARHAVEKFQAVYDQPVNREVLDNTPEGKKIAAALPDAWTSLDVLAQLGLDRAEKSATSTAMLFKKFSLVSLWCLGSRRSARLALAARSCCRSDPQARWCCASFDMSARRRWL